jgi:hypothetical protein
MNRKRSEAEHEFFLTGVKTWLDVEGAISEFRRQVQERCKAVVQTRLADAARASGIEWTTDDLRDYEESGTDGRYLGTQLFVEAFGRLYFYVAFYHEGGYAASVCLWRKRSNLAVDLWTLAPDNCYGNILLFGPELNEEQCSEFEEYLNQAIDLFIAFLTKAGGLKKYVASAEKAPVDVGEVST